MLKVPLKVNNCFIFKFPNFRVTTLIDGEMQLVIEIATIIYSDLKYLITLKVQNVKIK